MVQKIKKLLKEWKIWIFLIFLIVSILAIPSFKDKGAQVSFVERQSPFFEKISENAVITSINGKSVSTTLDYTNIVSGLKPEENVKLIVGGNPVNGIVKTDPKDNKTAYIGIFVKEVGKTRLSLGLDLQGGARVMLLPKTTNDSYLTPELFDLTTNVLLARLDAYGLKSVIVRKITDVTGNNIIIVEMAGEGSEAVVDIVKSVGRFELRILNKTIFSGDAIVPPIGEVAQDSRSGQWQVPFTINTKSASDLRTSYVALAPENPTSCSADTQCDAQYSCSGIGFSGGQCLPNIEMYLDNQLTFGAPPAFNLYQSWQAGEDSKNLIVQTNTPEHAKKVRVVLEAGRLPEQIESLEVISQDLIDPKLGKEFLRNAAIAGLAAILGVGIVIFVRYRKLKILIPIMITGVSEVIIVLGAASLIKWTIDLPAIAGLIASVGVGVEQQIIITDEILSGQLKEAWEVKKRSKVAFGIILIALLTILAAMFPLLYPGFTGLFALRGFAIVTIIGVLIGYFITRPAYAKIAETLLYDEGQ